MLRRRLPVIAVNVLLFLVFAEALSLVVYYYQHGRLYYTFRPRYPLIEETAQKKLTVDALHPYFGPTHRPGHPFEIPDKVRPKDGGESPGSAAFPIVKTNNFGFVSPQAYPFVKTNSNQVVIGLFGGSVGVWFCQLGADRLIEDLKRSEAFRGKELISLCFSHEGYKQPQQLLLLSYFLSIGQEFDLVINIDGFNEVALGSINDQSGLDISMPSFMHLGQLINVANQSTLTREKLYPLARITRDKEQLNRLAGAITRTRLASINFLWEQYYRVVSNRYQAELVTFNALPSAAAEDSVIYATPKVKPRDGAAVFEDIARNWSTASILMNQLLAARRVPYFHFLQPNQYYATKVFSAEEARVALSDDSPFKAGAEKGYPSLVAEGELSRLQQSHVRFFNAAHIFDAERQPVYMDNCCHYTLAGNRILADYMANAILTANVFPLPAR